MIRVLNHLKGGSANGLVANLTFDEGWQVKDYPVTILKPEEDALNLLGTAPTPGIGILQASEHDSKLECVLDAIALPRKMTEPEKPWYSTKFAFRKLKFGGVNPNLRPPYVSPTDLARLRIVVQPCRIYGVSTRLTGLSFKPDDGRRDKSRNFAAQSGITLETTIKRTPQDKPVSQVPEILSRSIAPHEKRSLVFLYREPDHHDKIDDVEVIDRTHVKAAPPCRDFSPTQLADSLFGWDSISDVENQTPRGTRKSSNRSWARACKQSPSRTASVTTALPRISSGHAEFLPTPFSPDNDSSSLADPTNVPARQETTDTASANPVYRSPHLERDSNEQHEEAGTTDVAIEAGRRAASDDTSLLSSHTFGIEEDTIVVSPDKRGGQPEDEPASTHDLPYTSSAPCNQPPQAWGLPGTHERAV